MQHHLETSIDIDAPASIVWDVLVDLDAYAEWNPFIVSSSGSVAVGERLVNRLQPSGGRGFTFKPRVTEVEQERVLEWLGGPAVPGIFDGRHRFELTDGDGGTTLQHSERFSGILVPLLRRWLDARTLPSFRAMNEALKDRAEARTRG